MTTTDRRLRVFLSYSPSESDEVRALYQRLTRDGVDAWLDTEKVLARHNWQREIEEAVRAADVVLICFAADFQLDFRKEEIQFALEEAEKRPRGEIFLIPVQLGEGQPPDFLDRYRIVNLFEMDGYESLIE